MKVFAIQLDYSEFFIPQSTSDAEKLMTIMSRGMIVKEDWKNRVYIKSDDNVNIRYIDLEKVLDKPIPEPVPPVDEPTSTGENTHVA